MSDGTFTLAELETALRPAFLPIVTVQDTGGGCIAARFRRKADDEPVSLGPGWFEGEVLKFRFSDFSICDEEELGPSWGNPADMREVVKLTHTAYKLYNNGRDHWEFTAEDILVRLRLQFPGSYCDQTGGGTATLNICKDADDPKEISVLAGPGQFHWNAPGESTFHTGEFSAGMDPWIASTDALRDVDETGPEVPIGDDWIPTPDALDRVARLIAEHHAIYNNGSYPN